MQGGLDAAGDVVVPPVELHEVECVLVEARQAAVDGRLDVGGVDGAQIVDVGHEFGVYLDLVGRRGAFGVLEPLHERADELFRAPVDVGAVERGEAAVDEVAECAHHVVEVEAAFEGVAV